jgi:hypothetical protein
MFFLVCPEVHMTKLQTFHVWAFCHTLDINTIIQFPPNIQDHIFVNTRNSCCDVLLLLTLTGGGTKKIQNVRS